MNFSWFVLLSKCCIRSYTFHYNRIIEKGLEWVVRIFFHSQMVRTASHRRSWLSMSITAISTAKSYSTLHENRFVKFLVWTTKGVWSVTIYNGITQFVLHDDMAHRPLFNRSVQTRVYYRSTTNVYCRQVSNWTISLACQCLASILHPTTFAWHNEKNAWIRRLNIVLYVTTIYHPRLEFTRCMQTISVASFLSP